MIERTDTFATLGEQDPITSANDPTKPGWEDWLAEARGESTPPKTNEPEGKAVE